MKSSYSPTSRAFLVKKGLSFEINAIEQRDKINRDKIERTKTEKFI